MDVLKCKALLEAVELGSIMAAAKILEYTPSGINRMINSLEDELGVILLNRSRNGVTLTDEGLTLLPAIRQFVRCGNVLTQTCAELNHLICGKINIGSFYSIASNRLPQVIRDFGEQYPGVFLDLAEERSSNLIKLLKADYLDCCFMSDPHDKELDFLCLEKDPIVVWAAKDHPLSALPSVPVRELENYSFISWNHEKGSVISHLCAAFHITLDIKYNSQDAYTIYRMVEQNLGIAANNLLTSDKWSGNISILPLDPPQYVELGIATSKNRRKSAVIDCFIQFIREHWASYL